MAQKKTIYGPSSCREEVCDRMPCPRCRGAGGVFGDEDGCTLCEGACEVWRNNGTGLTKPVGKRNVKYW